jgi:hypothetical protein
MKPFILAKTAILYVKFAKNQKLTFLSTGRRWLKERDHLGDQAYRRTRKISARLGPKYHEVATSILDDLLRKDHRLNTKPYSTQVKELHLPIRHVSYNTTLQLEKELGDIRSLEYRQYPKKIVPRGSNMTKNIKIRRFIASESIFALQMRPISTAEI